MGLLIQLTRGRGHARLLTLCVGIATSCVSASADTPSRHELEYRVKAAYLYNFAVFVTWPDEDGASLDPIVVGVLGDDPFGELLDATLDGKLVRERPLEIRRYASLEELGQCDVLFVAADQSATVDRILEQVGSRAVLTISELDGIARRGGVVTLYRESDRIRFRVNIASAERAGLKVSSRLLKLAEVVRETTP